MKCRWLIVSLAAFAVNVNAQFCTPENGQAWYLLSNELAREAKICRDGLFQDDDIEACRTFTAKYERTRKISSYVRECYESSRTGRNGLGYSSRDIAELNDNTAGIAAALESMREFKP